MKIKNVLKWILWIFTAVITFMLTRKIKSFVAFKKDALRKKVAAREKDVANLQRQREEIIRKMKFREIAIIEGYDQMHDIDRQRELLRDDLSKKLQEAKNANDNEITGIVNDLLSHL